MNFMEYLGWWFVGEIAVICLVILIAGIVWGVRLLT